MKLNSSDIFKLISEFVREDVGRGDLTADAVAPRSVQAKGRFIAEEECVLAGLEIADAVFAVLDAQAEIEAFASDGDWIKKEDCFARINGSAEIILTGEQVALNLLRHLSGVATLTRRFVDAIKGTPVTILDTPRTTPGLRALERYAVMTGGGRGYRMGLDDGILIRDSHIALAGGVKESIDRVRQAGLDDLHKIEVEIANRGDLAEALSAGADVVALHHLAPAEVQPLVTWAREERPDLLIGFSGELTLANARAYAETGVDFLAVGALTDSVHSVAISFKVST